MTPSSHALKVLVGLTAAAAYVGLWLLGLYVVVRLAHCAWYA